MSITEIHQNIQNYLQTNHKNRNDVYNALKLLTTSLRNYGIGSPELDYLFNEETRTLLTTTIKKDIRHYYHDNKIYNELQTVKLAFGIPRFDN